MIQRLVLLLALATTLALPALADEAASLLLTAPWARATPPGARVGGGYLTITNPGTAADRLLSASSPASEKVELHLMKTENGVMTMRAATDGVDIPAGGAVTFAPGGYHLMFIRPKAPFVAGSTVPLSLTFEKAGTIEIALPVQPIGAPAPAADMKMDGAAP